MAVWEAGLATLLERRPRYAAMGLDEETFLDHDVEGLNRIIYEGHRNRPLLEVLADFRAAHEHTLIALARLSEGDLFKAYSLYQPDEPGEDSGEPILRWIAGNT